MAERFAPGPWFRLTAVFATVASALAVASGAGGLGAAHRLLASLALPPLVALVVAAWLVARRRVAPWGVAFVLFGVAALVPGDGGLHLALAALALAASSVATVASVALPPFDQPCKPMRSGTRSGRERK